ncbi:hypothetical protein CONPUDRAFT_145659 [Coniophora puteana RWD-64-598 SS2]|uniref:Uncharacterized protein n=1 Tax=Coniophora puteana (strain RWD-64-598) TaxID=741705 RepID=A0A5M3MIG8_CONPW|nr:uncharacterized protein CONPUDRAFT_145659 [Coniophora puteana RWD-64-598 SS2]EIW78421.1 hypothetical protein CONPUDRAFT_145659 [Coniophora puteana RWD-64-598 SS2]
MDRHTRNQLLRSDEYLRDFPQLPSQRHDRYDNDNDNDSLDWDNKEHQPHHRKRLPIPDLRFEQTYLNRIKSCIHYESPRTEKGKQKEIPQDEDFKAGIHAVPLVDSSRIIARIDWGGVAWITLRDQVIMPLIQGMVWGVASEYIQPIMAYARRRVNVGSPRKDYPEGRGSSLLRQLANKLKPFLLPLFVDIRNPKSGILRKHPKRPQDPELSMIAERKGELNDSVTQIRIRRF